MIQTNAAEALLLEEIQKDLPLVTRPFQELGERCGMTEIEVISSLHRFTEDGIVREISALLDAKKIGFASSLVAVSISPELEQEAADRINGHQRVSHNYHRDHDYNIWFTIAAQDELALATEVSALLEPFPESRYEIMPALKTYKLRVSFRIGAADSPTKSRSASATRQAAEAPVEGAQQVASVSDVVPLSPEEQRLLSKLERPFPLVKEPWRKIGEAAELDENHVMEMTGRLKKVKVIRRVAGVLRHRKIGYLANGMSCFDVAEECIDKAGAMAAAYPEVSHCYWRRTPADWQYPLFAMVHAKTEEECMQTAKAISDEIESNDHLVLFSTIEYKKERAKYFGGDR